MNQLTPTYKTGFYFFASDPNYILKHLAQLLEYEYEYESRVASGPYLESARVSFKSSSFILNNPVYQFDNISL